MRRVEFQNNLKGVFKLNRNEIVQWITLFRHFRPVSKLAVWLGTLRFSSLILGF